MLKSKIVFINTALVGSEMYVFGNECYKECSFEINSAKTKSLKKFKPLMKSFETL